MRKYTLAMLLVFAPISAAVAGEEAPGVFWAVDGPGGPAGYLLGTIHSEDARVLEFTPEFLHLLGECRVFAMELVPDLPTLTRLTEYMHLPEGESLSGEIGAERFARVADALSSYGLPASQVERLKPWAAMMTLSVPPPQSGLFMDFSLSLRASGSGLEVVGLETLEQQLAFLENMPMEQQIQLLDHAVAEFTHVAEVHGAMIDAYLDDDLDALEKLAYGQMDALQAEARDYFIDEGVYARNRRMLRSMLPLLEGGGVLVAVGALHLPGSQGLLALLRDQGYRLEPLPPPFTASAASGQSVDELGN